MAKTYSLAKVVNFVEWMNREVRFVANKPKPSDAEKHWANGYIAGMEAVLERVAADFGVTSELQRKSG